MPPIFWTGKLSPMMKFVVNFSNAVAWVTGNARNAAAMKQRTKWVTMGLSLTMSPVMMNSDWNIIQKFLKHFLREQRSRESGIGCRLWNRYFIVSSHRRRGG